ncbi:helix-turn-helix domain-containing protein [Psychrobacillus vulpis]|uniref:Helix-turn-helix transcriptional regulator n=1 Tax=Psychrobacillus vulpis TaxID=2325572 RepID=A0A544TUQ3_9BACI|nr:helix-turn-helix domain-containing protein [Psychrobacillus vulpis]TQR21192.1 helix-turn-helix transcriptional regulator [Psychrobacillus vulpis]
MPFYEHIRAYREQLEITQIEAANRLGIDHSVLSKYELGKLAIPLDLLPEIRRVYAIPKDIFIGMLEDKRIRSKNPGAEAKKSRSQYAGEFQSEYLSNMIELKEFRNFISYLSSLDEKTMKKLLVNATKRK